MTIALGIFFCHLHARTPASKHSSASAQAWPRTLINIRKRKGGKSCGHSSTSLASCFAASTLGAQQQQQDKQKSAEHKYTIASTTPFSSLVRTAMTPRTMEVFDACYVPVRSESRYEYTPLSAKAFVEALGGRMAEMLMDGHMALPVLLHHVLEEPVHIGRTTSVNFYFLVGRTAPSQARCPRQLLALPRRKVLAQHTAALWRARVLLSRTVPLSKPSPHPSRNSCLF